MKNVMSAQEAVALIGNGQTVAVGGTGPVLEPDLLLEALQRRFAEQGAPSDLTVVSPMLPGARAGEGGLNAFAQPGMLRRIIGASFSMHRHPALLERLRANEIEGYIIGMGTMVQLMTAAAANKPGVWTQVGIGSFLDPRVEGGKMNARSTADMAEVTTVGDDEYLFYPVIPIDVAIIRGTTADENGYISFEDEPNTLGALEIAAATKANGGKVIVQVKRLARANSLDPRLVRIPGPLVDAIVVHPMQKQLCSSMVDPLAGSNPFLTGALKASYHGLPPLKDTAQRIMMRRAALELWDQQVVNLGAGVATQLPRIALEEGILNRVIFTNEHGVFGGLMATALGGSFVPALNADAIMDSAFQFNFYEGGGLDITFLGIGEIDAAGNVNVSKFGREWNAPGGFSSITERTSQLVFCGSLTSGGLKVAIEDGKLRIVQEGKHRKFVPQVEQITLNAKRAYRKGQTILYITERAVFLRGDQGPVLIEVAPGIDPQRDIAPYIGFPLVIAENLKEMDARIFSEGSMGLEHEFTKETSQ